MKISDILKTHAQAADYLGCSRVTVWKLEKEGILFRKNGVYTKQKLDVVRAVVEARQEQGKNPSHYRCNKNVSPDTISKQHKKLENIEV